ncbi:MAG: hypothetical protein L0H73_08575 [Nitrococcus sp.]|nr:hypothetical protein [Nitrococcus sp.]
MSPRLRAPGRNIAITMAALTLLAQLILALHGAVHLLSAGQDHCEIAQISHSFAAQLPSVSSQLVIPIPRQRHPIAALPAFMQSEPCYRPPIRAPPQHA